MNETSRESIETQAAFLGETLGLFYLNDPKQPEMNEAFQAFKDLDRDQAAEEWPFVPADTAARYLALMQQSIPDDLPSEDLIWEYRRLFIGPGKKPAPPWGSVYTDWEGVVFGETTLALRQWMREKGIERLADEKTPEDHIGLMLLLMAWIAQNKPEGLEEYLSEHFLTWSSHFLAQLEDAAEQGFYEGLAGLTRSSLEGLQNTLQLEIDYPRFYR